MARVAPKKPDKPEKPAGSYRVASLGDTPIRTAYASVDSATRDSAIDDSLLKKMTPRDPAKDTASKDAMPKDGPLAGVDLTRTAIYDIAAHVVYLPNGQRLEAHSGLAEHMDEIGSVNLRSLGPTPPGLYDLTMRESRFHGIDAIRLNPIDDTRMYGRAGILAHPYMLGPNGQSNGCVSLKDYPEFLAAFRRGEFNRIMVVERPRRRAGRRHHRHRLDRRQAQGHVRAVVRRRRPGGRDAGAHSSLIEQSTRRRDDRLRRAAN